MILADLNPSQPWRDTCLSSMPAAPVCCLSLTDSAVERMAGEICAPMHGGKSALLVVCLFRNRAIIANLRRVFCRAF
jgi:hypothetical protein